MSEVNVAAEFFAVGFFAVGGVLLGIATLVDRSRVALGFAGFCLVGGLTAAAAGRATGFWLPPTVLGGGYLALATARRFRLQILAFATRPRTCAAVALAAGPVLAVAWGLSGQMADQPPPPWVGAADAVPMPDLLAARFVARTDRGRAVRLGRSRLDEVPPNVVLDFNARFQATLTQRLIETAAPDPRFNCHGWVFTGGRFHIHDDQVDMILADNGYAPITQPAPGDLILYRDDLGAVVHSGLVRLANSEMVLVESKWGPLSRYVHSPADQIYSSHWAFYRSPRNGHALRIEPRPARSGDHR